MKLQPFHPTQFTHTKILPPSFKARWELEWLLGLRRCFVGCCVPGYPSPITAVRAAGPYQDQLCPPALGGLETCPHALGTHGLTVSLGRKRGSPCRPPGTQVGTRVMSPALGKCPLSPQASDPSQPDTG